MLEAYPQREYPEPEPLDKNGKPLKKDKNEKPKKKKKEPPFSLTQIITLQSLETTCQHLSKQRKLLIFI